MNSQNYTCSRSALLTHIKILQPDWSIRSRPPPSVITLETSLRKKNSSGLQKPVLTAY